MDRSKRQQSFGGHVREDNLVVVMHSALRDSTFQPSNDFLPDRQRQAVQIDRLMSDPGYAWVGPYAERQDTPELIDRNRRPGQSREPGVDEPRRRCA